VALALGMLTGSILYAVSPPENPIAGLNAILFGSEYGVLLLVGDVFIRLIKMMVVPLVFVSITLGAANIGDIKKLGRIGGKTLAFYLTTTAIAITIAILLALIIQPGANFVLPGVGDYQGSNAPGLVSVLADMVTKNPFSSLTEGSMLQIIVFSLFLGTGIVAVGKKAKPLLDVFEATNEVVLKLIMMIMHFAPFGVFALITKTFATLGWSAMPPLAAYMLVVLGALFIHAGFTYTGMLYFFTKLNPIQFFKNFSPAMAVAFSTSSSSSTIPVSIETADERCGVSKNIASFTLPLGATINMDGTAIMQGVATVFLAQAYGLSLGVGDYVVVILTATLASVGTAGVPGVGLIMLSMVLAQVGIPVEGIAFIIGIDRILDMTRTVVNVTGDAVCSIIIANSEGEFDRKVFNSENKSI